MSEEEKKMDVIKKRVYDDFLYVWSFQEAIISRFCTEHGYPKKWIRYHGDTKRYSLRLWDSTSFNVTKGVVMNDQDSNSSEGSGVDS